MDRKYMSQVYDTASDAIFDILQWIDDAEITNQAVVLDIDDTILHRNQQSKKWFRVEYMFSLYTALQSRNFKIYFITARPHSDKNLQKTLDQLHSFGYTGFEALFLMPGPGFKASRISCFKATIRELIHRDQQGVMLNIGNAWHDLLAPLAIESFVQNKHTDCKTYVFAGVGEHVLMCVKLPSIHTP